MAALAIADLRRDLATARCELLRAKSALRARRPMIEGELIARFCGGDPKLLGEHWTDRQRQLAVLSAADEELHRMQEGVRSGQEAVIRISAELKSLLDERRELERKTGERLADAIAALPERGAPDVAREAVLAEVGNRRS